MTKEIVHIAPEHIEVANCYLQYGNINAVCQELGLSPDTVVSILDNKSVKNYLNHIYLDTGYRNRDNIARVLDMIINKKLEEAMENDGELSKKDLADLLMMAHKMRMEEIKSSRESTTNNFQINDFGAGGNYGKLIDSLISP